MDWRPEGWRNPYFDLVVHSRDLSLCPDSVNWPSIFESGATAVLEALKAGGVKTNIYPVPVTRKEDSAVLPPFEGLVFAHMPTEGWLIFIPEAQE